MRWGEMYDTTKYPFIVDTGSTMIYLPPRKTDRTQRDMQIELELITSSTR